MKSFEEKLIKEGEEQSIVAKEINERDAEFRDKINACFEAGDIDSVRDAIKCYRQFLLQYHDKQDVDEILAKYYERLKKL